MSLQFGFALSPAYFQDYDSSQHRESLRAQHVDAPHHGPAAVQEVIYQGHRLASFQCSLYNPPTAIRLGLVTNEPRAGRSRGASIAPKRKIGPHPRPATCDSPIDRSSADMLLATGTKIDP